MYTINLYRTKSNAMVNGPQYNKFMSEIFPIVSKQINNMKSYLEKQNHIIKHKLTLHETLLRRPTKLHKNVSTRSRYSSSPKKVYPKRSTQLSINKTCTESTLENQEEPSEADIGVSNLYLRIAQSIIAILCNSRRKITKSTNIEPME